MRSIGICNKIINIIEKICEKATCAVVVDELLTEWFSVSVGQSFYFLRLCSIFFLNLSWMN